MVTVAAGTAAYADQVVNTLDNSFDATHEPMNVTVGTPGTTALFVKNVNVNGGDTNNACNLAGSATLTVDLASSDTSVATVSPSSLTFDACTDDPTDPINAKTVTVTALKAGTTTVTASVNSFTGTGLIDVTTATFDVNATSAANPCDAVSVPAAPTFTNGGSSVWYHSATTPVATSDGTVTYSTTQGGTYGAAPSLTEGQYTVYAVATSATCDKVSPESHESFNIDTTKPTASVTGVVDGQTYTLGSVPAAGCNTTDNLSGVATYATLSSSGGPLGSITATCSGAVDVAGNVGDSVSATYTVHYAFDGFYQPVDNVGWNSAKAGQAVPVKFDLGGNQGTNIFAGSGPKIIATTCPNSSASVDPIETYVSTAGGSSLTYDTTAHQYVYVWKTDKAWAGKCFTFDLALNDGSTTHTFKVQFTR